VHRASPRSFLSFYTTLLAKFILDKL
jgi:hypothetical protein